MPEQNTKYHPGIAAVLSFVFNGLGQLYNGQIFKGLTIIFFSAVSMTILIIGSVFIAMWFLGKIIFIRALILGLILFFLGIVSIGIIGIYSIIDAYQTALKK